MIMDKKPKNSKTWELDDEGMFAQSLTDIQDSSIRLFTETARAHNQAIEDGKEKSDGQ